MGKRKTALKPKYQWPVINDVCPIFGCHYNKDKRNVRIDTMQKHMRFQHGMLKSDPAYPRIAKPVKAKQQEIVNKNNSGVNFINILHALFSYKSLFGCFSLVKCN